MSVIGPVLNTCFKLLLYLAKTYHSTVLLASRRCLLSGYLERFMESVNPQFAPSHSKIERTRIDKVSSLLV